MRSKSIYFGTVLISLGIIGLVNNFIFQIDFSYTKYTWQVVLILLGFTFFSIPNKLKVIVVIISGLITGYFIYGIFHNAKFDIKTKKVVEILTISDQKQLI